MPITRVVADALGVVTICLVAVLVLLGVFCTVYLLYFRKRIRSQGLIWLNYFSGPWIIRIALISFAIWWGVWEIIRLNLLRREGRILDALNSKWQESICKCYIISNLGIAEPCLFLTLVFLLRASLQRSGTLNRKSNARTAGCIILFCLPMFILQLVVILVEPKYSENSYMNKLPPYFFNTAFSKTKNNNNVTICTYPLLSSIILGLFGTVLTTYLFWIGRQILHLVINKGLKKRVYTLVFSVSVLFILRVLLLGLSVLPEPENLLFDAIAFMGFFVFLSCLGVGICVLAYLPVVDSLAVRNLRSDVEARCNDEYNDAISLMSTRSPLEESTIISPGRNSGDSPNRGSMEKDETSRAFVELSSCNPSWH
ncbi:uncharacterized protein LOC111376972 [Olea europaea subsp. europaea]|uniref:Uncharacterized protein LOC111376972 n=1 Tax=Olea europaea subsp. europaea TaxID=158383 RepID=A0A8S0P6Z8_OLEEU|nr:uncharacterized protein LOC111376972 [Olea europaea subsp. europaea]